MKISIDRMKISIDILGDNRAHIIASPGDGTRYDLHVIPDVYGGDLVIWTSTGEVYRVFEKNSGENLDLKYLNRKEDNKWTSEAIVQIMKVFYAHGGFING
tara:strand:+ start:1152 stop:1454 length:303 start_codon:yes stop_codon:yes gene_type:complete